MSRRCPNSLLGNQPVTYTLFTCVYCSLASTAAASEGRLSFGTDDPTNCQTSTWTYFNLTSGVAAWMISPTHVRFADSGILTYGYAAFYPDLGTISMPKSAYDIIVRGLGISST